MKRKKLLIILVVLLSLTFSNIIVLDSINAASGSSPAGNKVWGYIYKGTLNLKNNKYGIEIVEKDGTKKFVVFDANGQKLAKNLVKSGSLKTGADISVNGVIKNNSVQVKSITEIIPKEQTFTGWLGDSDCTPHLKEPAEMGVKCLSCPHCEASGYGISIKQKDGSYKYYKFDANGQKLAKENIIPKVTADKVPEITVKGIREGEFIKVTSLSFK